MTRLHGFMSFAWAVSGFVAMLLGQSPPAFVGMFVVSAIHGCTDSIIKSLEKRS